MKCIEVNADNSKVMVVGGEEGLGCEVRMDGARLEQVSELKYFRCVLDESSTDISECSRKVASGKKVAGAIRSVGGCYLRKCSCLFCCMAVRQ